MKAWYFSEASKKLRYDDNREIAIGVTHKIEGAPVPCQNGLHGSVKLMDALKYAPGPVVWEVELGGDIVAHEDGDKLAATERTYLRGGIDITDTLRAFARRCALDVIHLWDAPEIVKRYLKTGGESIRGTAGDAAWDAARAAAMDAPSAAARAAAMDADMDAARANHAMEAARAAARGAARAAIDAAMDAAMDATMDAARAAARATAMNAAMDAAMNAAWAAGGDAAMDAAMDAARGDAGEAAWAAAMDAARAVAKGAARAARAAAWDAARAADMDAARAASAARGAAWDEYNTWLNEMVQDALAAKEGK